jgi:hypothetical protein
VRNNNIFIYTDKIQPQILFQRKIFPRVDSAQTFPVEVITKRDQKSDRNASQRVSVKISRHIIFIAPKSFAQEENGYGAKLWYSAINLSKKSAALSRRRVRSALLFHLKGNHCANAQFSAHLELVR